MGKVSATSYASWTGRLTVRQGSTHADALRHFEKAKTGARIAPQGAIDVSTS